MPHIRLRLTDVHSRRFQWLIILIPSATAIRGGRLLPDSGQIISLIILCDYFHISPRTSDCTPTHANSNGTVWRGSSQAGVQVPSRWYGERVVRANSSQRR